jgi:hypothetical protein
MHCQSYVAVMECLTMAEESRQTKSSGMMESCKQELMSYLIGKWWYSGGMDKLEQSSLKTTLICSSVAIN